MKKPSCKQCRAKGEKLFLKGEKCYTPKCPMAKRGLALHGKSKRRPALTTYGKQLTEKQKAKLIYGVRERQFHRYFDLADQKKGATPVILSQLLERRLDNVIFRAGFVSSRASAKKLISYGHFFLNGRRHTIPSTLVKKGDVISLNPVSLNKAPFKNIKERLEKSKPPKFLEVDSDKLTITIKEDPEVEELDLNIDFPSIVEFYSK
ncbi:MAG: small subunit ribosomal protein [Patescibacteria group bacterium]|nr:small subunit ribosomal protein [Patescibacteria group bacterium]